MKMKRNERSQRYEYKVHSVGYASLPVWFVHFDRNCGGHQQVKSMPVLATELNLISEFLAEHSFQRVQSAFPKSVQWLANGQIVS